MHTYICITSPSAIDRVINYRDSLLHPVSTSVTFPMHFFLLAAAAAASGATAATLSQACGSINPAHAPAWASGFSGRVVMNGLQSPRSVIFDKNGFALVLEAGRGVRQVKLRDNGGTNVCVDTVKQLVSDSSVNTLLLLERNLSHFREARSC